MRCYVNRRQLHASNSVLEFNVQVQNTRSNSETNESCNYVSCAPDRGRQAIYPFETCFPPLTV